MTIALPPEIEDRLKGEALRHGLPAEEYAKKLILEHLPPAGNGESLTDLFAKWDAEDATSDPAEIARRDRELEEFKDSMNRNRQDMEGPGARKLFP